jgi:oligopeptide/dipeptide ABC transporter ATP-binding protein
MLITHNLGLVAQAADRVMVMYAGRKVEEATVAALFAGPRHPYTQGLLGATPNPAHPRGAGPVLREIPGLVPAAGMLPAGCAFAPRCARAEPGCSAAPPPFTATADGGVACYVAARA